MHSLMSGTGRLHYVSGDATSVTNGNGPKIVVHVCNDIGAWGKGFVMAVSSKWPGVKKKYKTWHKKGATKGFRLGAVQMVAVTKAMCANAPAHNALRSASYRLVVANLIGQRGIRRGRNMTPIKYEAVEEGLHAIGDYATQIQCSSESSIEDRSAISRSPPQPQFAAGSPSLHMPRIGCGLAGGSWSQIEKIILKTLDTFPTLHAYVYDLP